MNAHESQDEMSEGFEAIFTCIREMFAAHEGAAVPKRDEPGACYLDTGIWLFRPERRQRD